jgi:hypothetical protein
MTPETYTSDSAMATGASSVALLAHTWSASVDFGSPRRMPASIRSDQAYYWTREWQEGEADAEAEIQAGDTRVFDGPGDAVRWLLSTDD